MCVLCVYVCLVRVLLIITFLFCFQTLLKPRILVFPSPSSCKIADCGIQIGNVFHFKIMNITCPQSNLPVDLLCAVATQALKKKRRITERLKQLDGQLATIEEQIEALEDSITKRLLLGAIHYGAEVLKAANEAMYVCYLLYCK